MLTYSLHCCLYTGVCSCCSAIKQKTCCNGTFTLNGEYLASACMCRKSNCRALQCKSVSWQTILASCDCSYCSNRSGCSCQYSHAPVPSAVQCHTLLAGMLWDAYVPGCRLIEQGARVVSTAGCKGAGVSCCSLHRLQTPCSVVLAAAVAH